MRLTFTALVLAGLLSPAFYGQGESPKKEATVSFEFREAMIPMRDGVRLQTVILRPKNVDRPLPILYQRGPYGVPTVEVFGKPMPVFTFSSPEKYIRVFQNIRGRFKSEGAFVMQRPPHDPEDPKGIDETTDAWDTVAWLIKEIPRNNGKVGIRGTSYDGWTAIMAALDPHPPSRRSFRRRRLRTCFWATIFTITGAFRLTYGFEYAALLETAAEKNYNFEFDKADTYDWYLGLGPLRNADLRYFHGKLPTWTDFVHHPNFDEFWKRQTVIRYLSDVKVPILHVAGWWDQEDFYGPQKIYAKLESTDKDKQNYFVAGRGNHGGTHPG